MWSPSPSSPFVRPSHCFLDRAAAGLVPAPLATDLPLKVGALPLAVCPSADLSLISSAHLVAIILLGLSAGWIIRYSRRASKFRAFWNQPTQDYELKQHHASLLKQGGMKSDDASSIRSKVSVATTVPKSTSTAHHHGRSPLAAYEDVNVGDRQCTSLVDHASFKLSVDQLFARYNRHGHRLWRRWHGLDRLQQRPPTPDLTTCVAR